MRDLPPAPVMRRLGAGALDALAVLGTSVLLLMTVTDLSTTRLPLFAVLISVIGWLVLPQALFGATLSMRLFGLAIIDAEGQRPDGLEVLFRELVGRGWFAIGWVSVGVLAELSNSGVAPGYVLGASWAAPFEILSWVILGAAAAGQCWLLFDPAGRGLAERLTGTRIVPWRPLADARALAAPKGQDEVVDAFVRQRDRRKVIGLVVAEVALGLGFIATHGLFVLEGPLTHTMRARKIAELTEKVDRGARDEVTLARLVESLTRAGRIEEADRIYRNVANRENDPSYRVGYALWLYRVDHLEKALEEMDLALRFGADSAGVHVNRGLILEALGREDDARYAYEVALDRDPQAAGARWRLAQLEPGRHQLRFGAPD